MNKLDTFCMGFTTGTLVMGLVCTSMLFGFVERIQQESVLRGYAEYAVQEDGSCKWQWKEVGK